MSRRPTSSHAPKNRGSAEQAAATQVEASAGAGTTADARHGTRERAKHLLVHRANGGIHNAALAMRFVTARVPALEEHSSDLATFVAAGLRGTADAARALQLLAALGGVESTSSSESGAYVDDVATLLRAESRRQGKNFALEMTEPGVDKQTLPAGEVSKMLVDALSALENAEANSVLALSVRARSARTAKPWELEIRKKESAAVGE
jgi:hypothetical protein